MNGNTEAADTRIDADELEEDDPVEVRYTDYTDTQRTVLGTVESVERDTNPLGKERGHRVRVDCVTDEHTYKFYTHEFTSGYSELKATEGHAATFEETDHRNLARAAECAAESRMYDEGTHPEQDPTKNHLDKLPQDRDNTGKIR